MQIFSPMGFISLGVIASNQRKYFQPTTNTDKIFKTVLPLNACQTEKERRKK